MKAWQNVGRIASMALVGCVAMAGFSLSADAAQAPPPAKKLTEQAVHNYQAGHRKQALAQFRQAADQGNRLAQFDYAMMLLNGEGGAKVAPQEAAQWLHKAAQAGMSQAQFLYGKMFDDGYVVNKSIKDANFWYGKAAEQGHIEAEAAMANEYFIGRGVPLDYHKAFDLYLKAARGGDLPSQYIVASYYEHGYGVMTPDIDQARVWYARAAAQGDVAALGKLRALTERRAAETAQQPTPGSTAH